MTLIVGHHIDNRTVIIRIITIILIMSSLVFAQGKTTDDFRCSLGSKYLSRFTAYGIDLADEKPALGFYGSIAHSSGIYTDVSFTSPLDKASEAYQLTFDAGYEKELAEWLSLSAELSQYFSGSDTLNLLSEFSNSVSVNADLSFPLIDLGFSYDLFLGDKGASYFSFNVSRFMEIGTFYFLPLAQVVFISQEVENTKLLKNAKKKKGTPGIVTDEGVALSGLANTILTLVTIYPLHKNISVTFVPTLILYHKEELSDQSANFVWNLGLRYRFGF